MITSYEDFVAKLLNAGFSMGGGKSDGFYSAVSWGWNEEPPYDTPVRWHTGDRETDPWEWRMRVLDERNDIAYAKLFFKKAGYITVDWFPYFLAVRRGGKAFEEEYASGGISHFAKRIYQVVSENGNLPLESIKQLGGFSKQEKAKFDSALTELQMKLYLTICGRRQKLSQKSGEYGWSSTVICTTESFWGQPVFEKAASLNKEEAVKQIRERIIKLSPDAPPKKIDKFIQGI